MNVRDAMRRDVVTISQDAPLRQAVRALSTAKVSGLPVVDDSGRLVGIVTEHDVVQAIMPTYEEIVSEEYAVLDFDYVVSRFHKVRDIPVSSIMTRNVVAVSEDDPLVKAASLILIRKVKRLPVVRGEELVGIVSRIDIVEAVLQSSC